jgi:hypothetical protein
MDRNVSRDFSILGSLILLIALAPTAKGETGALLHHTSLYSGGLGETSSVWVTQPFGSVVSGIVLADDSSSTDTSHPNDPKAKPADSSNDPNRVFQSCRKGNRDDCPPKKCGNGDGNDDQHCRHRKSGDN